MIICEHCGRDNTNKKTKDGNCPGCGAPIPQPKESNRKPPPPPPPPPRKAKPQPPPNIKMTYRAFLKASQYTDSSGPK